MNPTRRRLLLPIVSIVVLASACSAPSPTLRLPTGHLLPSGKTRIGIALPTVTLIDVDAAEFSAPDAFAVQLQDDLVGRVILMARHRVKTVRIPKAIDPADGSVGEEARRHNVRAILCSELAVRRSGRGGSQESDGGLTLTLRTTLVSSRGLIVVTDRADIGVEAEPSERTLRLAGARLAHYGCNLGQGHRTAELAQHDGPWTEQFDKAREAIRNQWWELAVGEYATVIYGTRDDPSAEATARAGGRASQRGPDVRGPRRSPGVATAIPRSRPAESGQRTVPPVREPHCRCGPDRRSTRRRAGVRPVPAVVRRPDCRTGCPAMGSLTARSALPDSFMESGMPAQTLTMHTCVRNLG
jgi:hypothetical protein